MVRLVVRADDVGMCRGANSAFVELSHRGGITSGSVMVPCPWFPEIAEVAARDDRLDAAKEVVGMFVGDEDPVDRLAEFVGIGANIERVRQEELGVDDHERVRCLDDVRRVREHLLG